MLNHTNLFPSQNANPASENLFVITLHHARGTLSRSALSAVQLQLDTRLGRLRRADAGHGPGGGAVGSRRGVVKVLPFGEVGGLLAEFGNKSFL
jgi:hypothetical protein